MRKSPIISFFGYATLILSCLGWGDALIGGFTLPHNPPFGAAAAAGCVLFSVPCFCLWAVGTTIHRARATRARMETAAMMGAAQRAQASSSTARPAGSATPGISFPPVGQ
jgi:hypothetical protein